MSIDAMKQALEVLSLELPIGSHLELKSALRAAIEQAHDWDEVEALRASLREHMAEIHRLRAAIKHAQAQEPVAWVYQEGLEALKSGRPWTAYGSSGEGRIPLYLNDAVAPKAEPRSGESGAGFESLPASSSTWWDEPVAQMNYRKWQGLTDEEIKIIWRDIDGSEGMLMRFARAIEAKLKEKNT